MLKYYCYISQNKVDSLFEQTESGDVESFTTSKSIDLDVSAKTPENRVSIMSLIGTDLNFGANGVLQFNKSIKIHYAKKLKKVLEELDKNGLICAFPTPLNVEGLSHLYYYYCGDFFVSNSTDIIKSNGCVDGIAVIESKVKDTDARIRLACSMKYFSDTRADGQYILHSTNYHFFSEKALVKFQSVFVLTGFEKKGNVIFGSPLFLVLDRDGTGCYNYL